MADQTPQQLLRDAATRIETALVLLDMRESACNHCQSIRYENFAHAKVYRQFADVPVKMRDAAARLDVADGRKSGTLPSTVSTRR